MIQLKNLDTENEIILNFTRLGPDETINIPEINRVSWSNSSEVLQAISDENIRVILSGVELTDFNEQINAIKGNYSEVSVIGQKSNPLAFAAKQLPDGRKLFRRKHGVGETIAANSSGTVSLIVPYTQAKINKLEVLGCSTGDRADLKVYDNSSGTISGVPNYMLNQFGFDVYLPDGMYIDESNYDADLISGMKVELTYYNTTGSAKKVGINITLHELVSA